MNLTTGIEWTDATSNPVKYRDKATGKVVWACVKHSPGCAHCYAETLTNRYGRGGPFTKAEMAKVEPFLCEKECRAILRALGSSPYRRELHGHPAMPISVPLEIRNRKGGDPAEWPEDLRIRSFPNV
jgi:hypothetical protein